MMKDVTPDAGPALGWGSFHAVLSCSANEGDEWMPSDIASNIKTRVIDRYVENYPMIGVVIGVVSPETPTGVLVCSSNEIATQGGALITLDGTTPFEIGSVSKLFTTGIFIQRHKYFHGYLGDPYLTQLSAQMGAVANVPVDAIARYASGLPEDNGYCAKRPDPYGNHRWESITILLDYLNNHMQQPRRPPWPPNTWYSYSNLGFAMLAMAAVEFNSTDTQQWGLAFQSALVEYCQQFGVDPPGYTATTTLYNLLSPGHGGLPNGYDEKGRVDNGHPTTLVGAGSGGIVSNGDDMLKFLLYCMGPDYPSWTQLQHGPPWNDSCDDGTTATGYGWFMETESFPRKVQYVWKDGGVTGFSSFIALEQRPNQYVGSTRGLFVLSNGPNAMNDVGYDALQWLFPGVPLSRPRRRAWEPRVEGARL
jgi:CubicO group peptidase (beta-lactamase class C family)